MTTIACWFNREKSAPSVWVCGDSKISSPTATLLESGAKIFSVPVLCFSPGESGFFDRPIYRTHLGLAYAGSSLVGLNLNAALTTCLSRLNTQSGPPSLRSIAELTIRLLSVYVSQLAVSSGAGALCEIALVGFCPIEGELQIYYLRPSVEAVGIEYIIQAHGANSESNGFVLLLGTDKDRISRRIQEDRRNSNDLIWWRVPKNVIRGEIHESENLRIGGHMQLGICSHAGFDIYSLCLPRRVGSPEAYLSYLGFDLDRDIGDIGGCFVGIPGMV